MLTIRWLSASLSLSLRVVIVGGVLTMTGPIASGFRACGVRINSIRTILLFLKLKPKWHVFSRSIIPKQNLEKPKSLKKG